MRKQHKPAVVGLLTGLFAAGLMLITYSADARMQKETDYTALCAGLHATDMGQCKKLFNHCTLGDQGRLKSCKALLTAGGRWCDEAAGHYRKGGTW